MRHTALPAPGNEEQLQRLAARIFSQRLDRTKPLWELWMVEGLAEGGFAVISKTHHSLVDGVSGVDLMTTLFDLDANGTAISATAPPWVPQPEPVAGPARRDRAAGHRRARAPRCRCGRLGALPQPERALEEAREAGARPRRGARARDEPRARHAAERAYRPAPAHRDRRGAARRPQGGQVRAGRHGQRRRARGRRRRRAALAARPRHAHRGPGHARLRADVDPLQRRAPARWATSITQVVAPLPVYLGEPLERLRVVREAMRDVKESKLAAWAPR